MITDPTALFALPLCVGILGLFVLILPLLILFWSQMEPQLAGLVGVSSGQEVDEYASHAVLPRLMKSYGDLSEKARTTGGKKPSNRAAAKSRAGNPTSTSRSKARSSTKKAAVKATSASASKSKAKGKTTAKATTKSKAKPKTAVSSKAKAAKAKPKSASKGTKAKPTAAAKKAKPKAKPKAAAGRVPSGAKRDQVLGLVYSKKPKEIDDLKEIKGVAKVIEAKLHKVGIYTFRQVVEWDSAAIEAVSEKLSFKSRIRNEEWQKQCAKFHKNKYGEKIG